MVIWKLKYEIKDKDGNWQPRVSLSSSKELFEKNKAHCKEKGFKYVGYEKLYPVCSWERNQHKLYNAHDRAMNAIYEGNGSWEEVDKIDQAIYAFESCVQGDLVYANWENSQLIKNYIYGYDARH